MLKFQEIFDSARKEAFKKIDLNPKTSVDMCGLDSALQSIIALKMQSSSSIFYISNSDHKSAQDNAATVLAAVVGVKLDPKTMYTGKVKDFMDRFNQVVDGELKDYIKKRKKPPIYEQATKILREYTPRMSYHNGQGAEGKDVLLIAGLKNANEVSTIMDLIDLYRDKKQESGEYQERFSGPMKGVFAKENNKDLYIKYENASKLCENLLDDGIVIGGNIKGRR